MPPEKLWLTIIGIGEDGPASLTPEARKALDEAKLVTGAPRHLTLLPPLKAEVLPWPAPFEKGIAPLLARRGQAVVMLTSGDPFWFGAGSTITRHLKRGEWVAHPGLSTFSLAAARLGWALQDTECLGLHAAPLSRLRRHAFPGRRAIVLLRDGPAVDDLAAYLCDIGFGASTLHILEALGGPREKIRQTTAASPPLHGISHPVAVGIFFAGGGKTLPRTPGLEDDWFQHDGQITKSPLRALTLSALAPRPGECLWDIGAGSGSISIEWLLAHPSTQAMAFEADHARAARARSNAEALGVDRLTVVEGRAPTILEGRTRPQAIFIGGGLSEEVLDQIWSLPGDRCRLVANAVTLESEALLSCWQAAKGGELLRIDIARASPLGSRRAWRSSYPLVQWSVTI